VVPVTHDPKPAAQAARAELLDDRQFDGSRIVREAEHPEPLLSVAGSCPDTHVKQQRHQPGIRQVSERKMAWNVTVRTLVRLDQEVEEPENVSRRMGKAGPFPALLGGLGADRERAVHGHRRSTVIGLRAAGPRSQAGGDVRWTGPR
jgi:hypothetical protein